LTIEGDETTLSQAGGKSFLKTRGKNMSALSIPRLGRTMVTISVLIAVGGFAQDRQASTTDAGSAKAASPATNDLVKPTVPEAKASEPTQPATTQPPTSVQDVVKMMEAGVSKEVLKAYVENNRFDYVPTAQDLILLKQHAVPDDITTALVKRSAEAQAQKPQTPASVTGAINLAQLEMDPEGYSYFQHYYLFPRTLAYVYDRLGYAQGFPGYYFPLGQPFGPGYGYAGRFLRQGAGFRFYPPGALPPR
jgi:hypothetical protein